MSRRKRHTPEQIVAKLRAPATNPFTRASVRRLATCRSERRIAGTSRVLSCCRLFAPR